MDGTGHDATGTQGYEARLADLGSMSDEDLAALETEIVAAFDAADAADDLDAMSAAADALDQVRAEQSNRGGAEETPAPEQEDMEPMAASADTPEETPEAQAEVEPTVASGEEPAPDTEESEAPAAEDVPEETAPPEVSTEDQADATSAGPEGSTASTEGGDTQVEIPEDRQPVPVAASSVITYGADIPGRPVGGTIPDRRALGEAMTDRIHSLRGAHGSGEQHIVATVTAAGLDEERTLVPGDLEGNIAKIEQVIRPEHFVHDEGALVAAGGYCAPLESRYDIFGLGVADRPVRDSLAGFNASRGGIRYTSSPILGDLEDAVGLWTAVNDADPTPSPASKPCLVVACQPEQTAVLDAVTLCLQFGNLMSRAYPELVSRNNDLGLIQHARLGELTLLSKMEAGSTAVTSSFQVGVARDFLTAIGRAGTAYRGRHRMNRSDPLRVIAPAWVLDAIREDLALQAPGDDALAVADATINTYLAARNVNITWHLDHVWAAEAAGALDSFPSTIEWFIFAEGTWLYLDGGTLDLGVIRDSDLVGTNDYKMFVETFEGVAKVGVESIFVTTTTSLAGSYAGPTDTIPGS